MERPLRLGAGQSCQVEENWNSDSPYGRSSAHEEQLPQTIPRVEIISTTSSFPHGSAVKNPPAMWEPQEMQVQSLGQEDPLEKKMATHSSILACRILRTEKFGKLQSMGSQSQTGLKQLSTHTRTKGLNTKVLSGILDYAIRISWDKTCPSPHGLFSVTAVTREPTPQGSLIFSALTCPCSLPSLRSSHISALPARWSKVCF